MHTEIHQKRRHYEPIAYLSFLLDTDKHSLDIFLNGPESLKHIREDGNFLYRIKRPS